MLFCQERPRREKGDNEDGMKYFEYGGSIRTF